MTWAHGFRDSPWADCCFQVTARGEGAGPKVTERGGPGASARVAKIGGCGARIVRNPSNAPLFDVTILHLST